MGESGGDFVADCALATSSDLRNDSVRLMFAEGQQQNGLAVGVQLRELALEVEAAHQRGVKSVGAGVNWPPTWRGVVSDPASMLIRHHHPLPTAVSS